MKTIPVSDEIYEIIQITKETIGVSEEDATMLLMKIGLFNITNFPCGNSPQRYRSYDKALVGKYPNLLKLVELLQTRGKQISPEWSLI